MRKFVLVSFTALAVLFGAQRSADASAITFTGAPMGMTFSIESVVATTDLFTESPQVDDTYLVTLQLITTTDYADADRYLQSVALDVGGDVDDAKLVSSIPVSLTWEIGNLNTGVHFSNGKCVGGPIPGAVCVEENPAPTNILIKEDTTYNWVFKIDVGPTGTNVVPSLVFATATWKDSSGNGFQWEDPMLSELLPGSGPVITPLELPPGAEAPEPASMVLLGTGLAGLVAYRRLRRR